MPRSASCSSCRPRSLSASVESSSRTCCSSAITTHLHPMKASMIAPRIVPHKSAGHTAEDRASCQTTCWSPSQDLRFHASSLHGRHRVCQTSSPRGGLTLPRSRHAAAGGGAWRPPAGMPRLLRVLQGLRLGQALELLQRVVLDLTDPLAGHAECAADLLEGAWMLALQAEPQLDDLALTLGEGVERPLDVLLAERHRGRVEGRRGGLVPDEIAQLALLLLADRLLEADRQLRHAQDLAHLVGGHVELAGDLLRPRVTP